MKIRLLACCLLAFFACKSGEKKTLSTAPLLELRTTGCYGYCPVYRLLARHDGSVEYEGIQFVNLQGKTVFYLQADELARLKAKIEAVNLWQYPDVIETRVADAPGAVLSVYKGGKTKSVRGSMDRPKPVVELENLFKDLAEAHDLKVKRGVAPSQQPASAPELIVRLRPGVKAQEWIKTFSAIHLRLLERISADNTWRIGYDPKEIEEKGLVDLLKSMEDVLSAEPNLRVEDRN